MVWQTPKTNWTAQDSMTPSELNRIEGNIAELKKAATIDIADTAGNFAATNVEDALQELAGNVKNGKTSIANAITAMGQSASGGDTFDTLAAKIRDISKDATAGTGDVLSGKTFYQGGAKKTGTMPNRGAVVITPSTQNQTIPAGYHNGQGYVKGDVNLVPANIAEGKTVFGVQGTANSFRDRVLHLPTAAGYTLENIFEVGIQEGDATVIIYEATVIIYSSNNNYGSAVTKTSYNLTPYNYLVIFGFWYGNFTITFDIVTSKTAGKDDYIRQYRLNENNLDQHVYDIGSLSGNYYFRIGGARTSSSWESARIISSGIILV